MGRERGGEKERRGRRPSITDADVDLVPGCSLKVSFS